MDDSEVLGVSANRPVSASNPKIGIERCAPVSVPAGLIDVHFCRNSGFLQRHKEANTIFW